MSKCSCWHCIGRFAGVTETQSSLHLVVPLSPAGAFAPVFVSTVWFLIGGLGLLLSVLTHKRVKFAIPLSYTTAIIKSSTSY